MIPKQKDETWNDICQALQDTKIFISKVKKQSDGHTLDS
jgi:hypothetical protein